MAAILLGLMALGQPALAAVVAPAEQGCSVAPNGTLNAGEGLVGDLLYGARPGEGLPGGAGVEIPRRPTITELENLTIKHGVEFGVTCRLGSGPNGAGGTYFLHSGTVDTVPVPIAPDSILIYHTHPSGTPWASAADRAVMDALAAAGSPQRSSCIIPVGSGCAVPFGGN